MEKIIEYGGYVIAVIITGILYFFPARRKELDNATAKLIKTLQETVGALERDLNIYKERTVALEEHQRENITKIASIEAERQLLKDFIAGRDKETEKFQSKTIALHESNSEKIIQLVDLLNKHFLTMEKAAMSQ